MAEPKLSTVREIDLSKYDLIGYRVVSPLHLTTLRAFAQQIATDDRRLNVLVIVSTGPWRDIILNDRPSEDDRVNLYYIDEKKLTLSLSPLWLINIATTPILKMLLPRSKKQIPVCSPTLASLKFCSSNWRRLTQFRPVVLDEGIGSFSAKNQFKRESARRFSNVIVHGLMWRLMNLAWEKQKHLGVQRVSLFSFTDSKPVINKQVAESYKAVFFANYRRRKHRISLPRRTALVLTQPFSEGGTYTKIEELQALKSILASIEKKELIPCIKPHPAESPDKYRELDVRILDYPSAVEEVFCSCSSSLIEIWGFTSTSLITGAALYGLNSLSVELPQKDIGFDIRDSNAKVLFEEYTKRIKLRELPETITKPL